MSLVQYRNEIDEIDSQIIDLFEKRMSVCAKVAEYKIENNLPVLDQSREDEKMKKLSEIMSKDMKEYGTDLYSCIFELSRKYQKTIMDRK